MIKPIEIARVCHEVNRAICQAAGDQSQKHWEGAEQWQRESAIRGVAHVIANPHATPRDQHAAWAADKRADGWIYGPTKDAGRKTHPCLVEFEQLAFEQRVKDYAFIAVVQAML